MADRAHHGPGATPRETGAVTGPRGDIVDGAGGRRTQDPSGWLVVRRDGTVVAAERRACELLGAPDPDALAGRDWRSLASTPDGAEVRDAGRALEAGSTWEGQLRFRYARIEVTLAVGVAPVARSSELMVMSLLTPGRVDPSPASPTPESATPGSATPATSTSMAGVEQAPVMGRDGFRALVSAYDAQQDLDDPASIAHAVLQAIEGAIGFDWAAVLRYVPGPALALEVVAAYPTPMAGVSRGVRWSPAEPDEAFVYRDGEPSMQGDLRRRPGSASPLDRLPAFGLRSRILIPLFGGADVAGALALFRTGPLAFTAAEGILAERTVRRLGEALAAPAGTPKPAPTSTPPDLRTNPPAPSAPSPAAARPAAGDGRAPIGGDAGRGDRDIVGSRLESLGELVAGVAHELNNPLTAILGYAQILGGLEGAEREHALRTIEDEAQRAARIVRNLLSFARQRPGQRHLVNIEEMLRRVIDLRRYALEVDNVRVVTHLGLVPELELDEGQFEQVFLNLLNNAQQALQARGGEVVISTWQDERSVYVTFADNGPGVPEELHARIFEPFFTTREVGRGQGMGLAIVYGVVTHHGGRTWVEANPEGGATFAIELPLDRSTTAPVGEPSGVTEEVRPAVLEGAPERATGRVLVVEDEAPVLALTCEILGAAGYTVQAASDGIEALRLLEEDTFDLIVSDLRMPGMDGATLYRRVVERWPEMEQRVLFVTGDIEGSPDSEALDSTSLRYLQKPFTKRQLVTAVGECLLHAATPGAEPVP